MPDAVSMRSLLAIQARDARETARSLLRMRPTASADELLVSAGLLVSSLSGLALALDVEIERIEALRTAQEALRVEEAISTLRSLLDELRAERASAEALLSAMSAARLPERSRPLARLVGWISRSRKAGSR